MKGWGYPEIRQTVREAAAWIDQHFYEELTPTMLAEQLHVEHSYSSRVLGQEIGQNPVLWNTAGPGGYKWQICIIV